MMLIAVPMLPIPGRASSDRPIVGAVARRKRLRGQRSVSPPADVGCVAGAVQAVAAEKAEVEQQSAERGQPETEAFSRGNAISRAPIISGTR